MKSHKQLITVAREDSNEDLETTKHCERKKKKWHDKVLHVQYLRQTKDAIGKKSMVMVEKKNRRHDMIDIGQREESLSNTHDFAVP